MVTDEAFEALAVVANLGEPERFVLEVIRRLEHPILNHIFFERLRPYQVAWVLDFSRYRIALKGRRLGFTEADGLDTVLTSSGFWEYLGTIINPKREALGLELIRFPKAHNTNVISKRDKESLDYVRRCKRWIAALTIDCSADIGDERDKDFRSFFKLTRDNDTFFKFQRSGWLVQSDTQSEGAGRGQEGHLKKDEAAHYRYARQIVAGADKIPLSSPDLRISEFSTPNGTEGPGEVFYLKWSDAQQFGDYSRHEVNLTTAIEQGFPITEEDARKSCLSDEEFDEEFMCRFVGSAGAYFTRDLLAEAESTPPSSGAVLTIIGIDVASEVDLTALTVVRKYGSAAWVEQVWLIRGTPYATGSERIGQEDLLAALMWTIGYDVAILDASADGAELYGRLVGKGLGSIVPHSFHSNGQQWKQTHLPRLRNAMTEGKFLLAPSSAKPMVYVPGLVGPQAATVESASSIVESAFRPHHFDLLKHDFRQVRRKLLSSGVTFDSPRNKQGHGDAFWSCAMAFSMLDKAAADTTQKTQYERMLEAALGDAGAGLPGSDYADFI